MPTALVFYHYLYPDDVVSAIHFGQLCQGLRDRGWEVIARPCNRGCRDETVEHRPVDDWGGIRIERVWRPKWRQSSATGRMVNALWMIARWSLDALRRDIRPDVVIIGTDPVLSVFAAVPFKLLTRSTKVVHWCFDLYPEAAFADGVLNPTGIPARMLQFLMRRAYRACDLIADIGPCMRKLLERYDARAQRATLVPWALEEPRQALPVSDAERSSVFGAARLALMYSGTFGRAHECSGVLALARGLRDAGVKVAFSVRGNREQALRDSVLPEDTNVTFVPFAASDKLSDRLAAADIHIVSLREEWTGTVVPSKFFGALAIGRPVLFFGSPESAIAVWIQQHGIGWVWRPQKCEQTIAELRALAEDKAAMAELRARCHRVYEQHFSRRVVLDGWNRKLNELLAFSSEPVQIQRELMPVSGTEYKTCCDEQA